MQSRKIDVGVLLALLVIALAMVLLLVTPAHAQETTLAEKSVDEEQTLPEADTTQGEQSAVRSATQLTAQQATTPSEVEATAQQTATPSTASQPTEQSSAQQQDGCRVVDTFSGSGETRTDTPFFTIVGPQWRVAYETVNIAPPPVGMLFAFFIRNERGQALDPNGVAIRSDESGIKNVVSDPGKYYIQIISSQVDWTLRVEDCGSPNGNSNSDNAAGDQYNDGGGDVNNPDQVIPDTTSKKPLPNTGGVPLVGLAVVALAFVGVGFSVLGTSIRRDP